MKKSFDLYQYHYEAKENILISYKGPFDTKVLSAVSSYIRTTLRKTPKASKKLHFIFMELAQNISYYSALRDKLKQDDNFGIGSIVLIEANDHYRFLTGNIIKNEHLHSLIDKIEVLNSYDTTGLREFKRKQMRLPDNIRDGANIGLVEVAITSANPVGYESSRIDEEISFFTINVRIDKR